MQEQDQISARYSTMPVGSRVAITQIGDDSDVVHRGVVTGWRRFLDGAEVEAPAGQPGGWVEVQIDGERVRHEWPAERVWPEDADACGRMCELLGGRVDR